MYLKLNMKADLLILLSNSTSVNSIEALLNESFTSKPEISMSSVSYHYEYNYFKKNSRVKRVTSTDQETLNYYSVRDVSGPFKIDKVNKGYLHLLLNQEIHFADPLSYDDYMKKKINFWKKNRDLDFYMDYDEKRSIPNLKPSYLIYIGDGKSFLISRIVFWVFCALGFSEPYKLIASQFIQEKVFRIRKIISTRNDLGQDNSIDKTLIPKIILKENEIEYNVNEISMINDESQLIDEEVSKEEEEKIKDIYKNLIPNYSLSEETEEVDDLCNHEINKTYLAPPKGFLIEPIDLRPAAKKEAQRKESNESKSTDIIEIS